MTVMRTANDNCNLGLAVVTMMVYTCDNQKATHSIRGKQGLGKGSTPESFDACRRHNRATAQKLRGNSQISNTHIRTPKKAQYISKAKGSAVSPGFEGFRTRSFGERSRIWGRVVHARNLSVLEGNLLLVQAASGTSHSSVNLSGPKQKSVVD